MKRGLKYTLAIVIIIGIGCAAFVLASGYFRNGKTFKFSFKKAQEESDFYGSRPDFGNKDYFEEARAAFIKDKQSFIEANLSEMKIRLFKEGEQMAEIPIKARGKEGTWWETPAGIYRIETKEKNHFSSFAGVYQPWSMQFQGNFFIHGWPYYPDGTPVASTYSGGCIRLSEEDSKMVYDFASVGTPVLVYKEGFIKDSPEYGIKIPALSAESYMATDLKSGFIFTEKGKDKKISFSDPLKLLSGLVALEYINVAKDVTTDNELLSAFAGRLYAGEQISAYNLLYLGLAEYSSAAFRKMSDLTGESRFIGLMNKKAKAIGMSDTSISAIASDSEDSNLSTANDIITLARYVYHNRSFIFKVTSGRADINACAACKFPAISQIKNKNPFVGNPEFVGGIISAPSDEGEKTESGIAVFEININGEKRPIGISVSESASPANDITNIKDWIKNVY